MFPSKKPLSIFFFFNDGTTHPQSFDDFRRLAKRHPLLWHSVTSFPSSPLHSVVQRRQQQHTRQIESTHSSQASNNGLRHARSRNVRAFLCFLLFRRCIFFFPLSFFFIRSLSCCSFSPRRFSLDLFRPASFFVPSRARRQFENAPFHAVRQCEPRKEESITLVSLVARGKYAFSTKQPTFYPPTGHRNDLERPISRSIRVLTRSSSENRTHRRVNQIGTHRLPCDFLLMLIFIVTCRSFVLCLTVYRINFYCLLRELEDRIAFLYENRSEFLNRFISDV